MNILNFINTYLIKYLYIVVIISLVIAIIEMFIKGIMPLLKTLNGLLDTLNEINKDSQKMQEDIDRLSFTANNSIPLFVDIAFALAIVRAVLKDYFKTKDSKKSIIRSSINEYQNISRKYNRQLSPETIKQILEIIKLLLQQNQSQQIKQQ